MPPTLQVANSAGRMRLVCSSVPAHPCVGMGSHVGVMGSAPAKMLPEALRRGIQTSSHP
jgi:hypothetical protein